MKSLFKVVILFSLVMFSLPSHSEESYFTSNTAGVADKSPYWWLLFSNRYPATVVKAEIVAGPEFYSTSICEPGEVLFNCNYSWDFCSNNPGEFVATVNISWIDANDTKVQSISIPYRHVVNDPEDLDTFIWGCAERPGLPPRLNDHRAFSDLRVDNIEVEGSGVSYSNGTYRVPSDSEVNVIVTTSGTIHPKHALGGSEWLFLTVGEQQFTGYVSNDALSAGSKEKTSFKVTIAKGVTEISAVIDPYQYMREKEATKANNTRKISVSTAAVKSKIQVSSVQLAQVVYNPTIAEKIEELLSPGVPPAYVRLNPIESTLFHAVLGKSLSFRPTVKLEGAVPEGSFYVQVIDESNKLVWQSDQKTFKEAFPSSSVFQFPKEISNKTSVLNRYVPESIAVKKLVAKVVSTNSAVEVTEKSGLTLNVYKTYAPSVGMIRVNPSKETEKSVVNEAYFQKMLGYSDYISDLFPVADKSIKLVDKGALKSATGDEMQLGKDMKAMEVQRLLLGLDRLVGIVSDKYPPIKSRNGLWSENTPGVVVVKEGFVHTMAHELTHSFGVQSELYENLSGATFYGFNARTQQSYTGFSVSDAGSFDLNTAIEKLDWKDDRNYSINMRYLLSPFDKMETMLIAGLITKTGSVENLDVYKILKGKVHLADGLGNLQVKVYDKFMKLLYETTFPAYLINSMEASVGAPVPTAPSTSPFAVQIPKIEGVDSIQIVKKGVVISTTKLDSMYLSGVIERIPLAAYRITKCSKSKNPDEFRSKERDVLRTSVKVIQKEIDKGNSKKAKLLLEGLVVQIKLLTSNSYVPANEAELSQSSVVSEVRALSKKLN